jgi:type II secretory ATPase GspE/PulE/Tfp pilus assembly ATPase PilB-like protein
LATEAFRGGQFRTLRQDGILKVLAGLTSMDEVRANSNA